MLVECLRVRRLLPARRAPHRVSPGVEGGVRREHGGGRERDLAVGAHRRERGAGPERKEQKYFYTVQ